MSCPIIIDFFRDIELTSTLFTDDVIAGMKDKFIGETAAFARQSTFICQDLPSDKIQSALSMREEQTEMLDP